MKLHSNVWMIVACLTLLTPASTGVSQTLAPGSDVETNPSEDYLALLDARERRIELADDVASGKRSPESALTQLRTIVVSVRLKGDTDISFAHAAIDVGQRLVAAERATEAGSFFRAADEALSGVLERADKDDAAAWVQMLSNRAFIRAQFLGKVTEAIADLDAAAELSPDDPHLQDLRRQLLSDKAAWLSGRVRN